VSPNCRLQRDIFNGDIIIAELIPREIDVTILASESLRHLFCLLNNLYAFIFILSCEDDDINY